MLEIVKNNNNNNNKCVCERERERERERKRVLCFLLFFSCVFVFDDNLFTGYGPPCWARVVCCVSNVSCPADIIVIMIIDFVVVFVVVVSRCS